MTPTVENLNRLLYRKTYPSATLSTANPARMNVGLDGDRQKNNRLNQMYIAF